MSLKPSIKSIALAVSIVINTLLIGYIIKELYSQPKPIVIENNIKDDNYFSEYFKVDDRILFVGNSLVYRCDWKELLNNPNIENKGVGGITTYEIFMRYNNIIKGKPKKIFFLMGINDLLKEAPESLIMENFHRILYQLKASSPLTEVYFLSLLPVNPELRNSDTPEFTTNEAVDHLNLTIKNFTDTFGLNYIDVNSILKNENGSIDSTLSEDGVHVKQIAYEKMKAILKEKVEE
jgi:lysophospholipase L1-like esterase